jgi:hypothetical protein
MKMMKMDLVMQMQKIFSDKLYKYISITIYSIKPQYLRVKIKKIMNKQELYEN